MRVFVHSSYKYNTTSSSVSGTQPDGMLHLDARSCMLAFYFTYGRPVIAWLELKPIVNRNYELSGCRHCHACKSSSHGYIFSSELLLDT
eukprot:5531091-Pleurochrysis_carterae.AAC.3